MSERRKCAKLLFRRGYLRLMPCLRPATRKEGGEWWCWTHAPSLKAQREKMATARWEAEEAKRQRGCALHDASEAVLKAAREWSKAARDPVIGSSPSKLGPYAGAVHAAVDALLALESEGA